MTRPRRDRTEEEEEDEDAAKKKQPVSLEEMLAKKAAEQEAQSKVTADDDFCLRSSKDRKNCHKVLAGYRLTCNIQIIKLEWPDMSSWGQDFFRDLLQTSLSSEEVLAPRRNIRPLLLYDLYIAGQPVVSEQFVPVHYYKRNL